MIPLEIARELHAKLTTGDATGALALMSDDIEWITMMDYKIDGRGPQKVLEGMLVPAMQEWEPYTLTPHEFICDGDKVVSVGRFKGTNRMTGKHVEADYSHIWEVREMAGLCGTASSSIRAGSSRLGILADNASLLWPTTLGRIVNAARRLGDIPIFESPVLAYAELPPAAEEHSSRQRQPPRLAATGEATMSRLAIPAAQEVPDASKPILDAVQRQLGSVPNMFLVIAQSPAALQGYVANNGALSKALDLKTRERIALAVAQVNGCDYCLSAHSYLGLNLAKITTEEIALNRRGGSGDARADAAVRFAAEIVRERGHVSAADIQAVRDAGFSDAQLVEIVAVTAENVFTNLLNVVVDTDIDFPVVHARDAV